MSDVDGSFDTGPLDSSFFDGGPFDGGSPREAGIVHEAGFPPDGGRVMHDGGRFDGGPRVDAGRTAIALRFFDHKYVFAPDRPGLHVQTDSTYEMWIRPRAAGVVSYKGQRTGQRHLYIEIEVDPEGRSMLVVGWVNLHLEPRLLSVPFGDGWNRWIHLATVFERVGAEIEMRLYVDFTEVAAGMFPNDLGNAFNTERLVLGQFDGDIDEVRLWRSVRSADTLRATAFTRVLSGTTSLGLYWPIEEAPGQLLLDRALRGNDAILGALNTVDAADPMWIFDGVF